jgi:hypothetical protein
MSNGQLGGRPILLGQQQQTVMNDFVRTYLNCLPAVAGSVPFTVQPADVAVRAMEIARAGFRLMGVEIQTQPPAAG